jgi:hypothetical protein
MSTFYSNDFTSDLRLSFPINSKGEQIIINLSISERFNFQKCTD